MQNKKVKHLKIKNTGILFEVLTRQLTVDIINGKEKSKAQELIEKNFKNNTELGKEHRLYQALVKHRLENSEKALTFIDEVIHLHKKLNKSELKNAKYNLIKEIKESYNIDSLFKTKLDNYKIYASIFKLLQAKSDDVEYLPQDVVSAKYTIVEHITGKDIKDAVLNPEEEKFKAMISEYEKQNEGLRLLTYKIMVERFNEKYSVLNENQKSLLKEYINNVSNTNSLKSYVSEQIPKIVKELTELSKTIDDKVIRIKINEVLNQMDLLKESKSINDNHVVALLNTYELMKELKSLEKKNG
jgi:hypothetical protein